MSNTMVLCVDDEEIVLSSLKMQLRNLYSNEFELETTTSPEEALEILKAASDEGIDIPVIITDYIMPRMKGDQFLEKAQLICGLSKKVMLTGQSSVEGVKNAVNNSNLFAYISKPWDEFDLKLTIDKAMSSYYSEKEVRRLVKKNEKLYKKMKNYFVSTIKALANAIDARDTYTNGHSQRVTYYSVCLGKLMGLEEERLEKLEYMGILHDVGKIGIPDTILLKESKLSDEEYEIMKTHVQIGKDILKNIADYEQLLPGILYHHERIDGKGYLKKTNLEEITLEARIICITDAFDAMTSDRPYRAGMSKEDALAELNKWAGTQFDKGLVDLFSDFIKDKDLEEIFEDPERIHS